MLAHIITIGDELLIGQVIDTNSAYIAKELNQIGIQTIQISSIQDEAKAITETLDIARKEADIIIITGGLGPTKDDITKTTLAQYFDDTLVFHQESFDNLKRIFDQRKLPISDTNRKQAELPSRCEVLLNFYGTASGMYFKENDKHFFSLPGVPFEMEHLIQEKIKPLLQERFKLPFILNQTIITQGIGESFLSDIIEKWELALPSYIKLAYLPSPSRVRLRLSGKHHDEQVLKAEFTKQVDELVQLIPQYIVSLKGEDVENVLGEKLKSKNWTLATAESCTGGKIAHKITSVSGSSAYFKGSVVAYSSSVKEHVLQIPKEIIDTHTVVSQEVAQLMAENVKRIMQTDFAIATTGVAGPNQGEDGKAVGTVYTAIATPTETLIDFQEYGILDRSQFIERVSGRALQLLHQWLMKQK